MLNLNLNIIGGALRGNKSSFDANFYWNLLQNFYTASLKGNAALEVVVSGSDTYFGPRNYRAVVSSSSTPSIEGGIVSAGSGNFLVEQDSSVTASFKGFPDNWNVVQFGSASVFSNVTMSLDIPEAGISIQQYETSSFMTASFVADPKGVYNVNATITINPYYTSTIVENFNIPSSSIVNQLVTASASGFLLENTFITSTSGSVLNQVSAKESGSVDVKLKGEDGWNIVPTVYTSPSSSVSLVTMSMEIPEYGVDVRAYTTSSIISASIGGVSPYLEDNGLTDVDNIVNVKNAFIPIDYLVVGGGNKGASGVGFNNGGGGGFATQGNFILKVDNKNSISAEIGKWGRLLVDTPSTPAATSSSLYYLDTTALSSSLTRVSANGAAQNDAVQGCSTFSQVGAFLSPWLDGQFYGGRGADTRTGTGCPPVTSSIVPFNAGRGGNRGAIFGDDFGPNNGVVALRYYDPNNSFIASLTSGTAVTYASGGYKFIYLTNSSSLNTLSFNLTDQEFIVPIDNLPGTEAYLSSSYTQNYWTGSLSQNTLLNVGVTGSGYSPIPKNRAIAVSGSNSQSFNLVMDEGSNVNVGFEGFTGWELSSIPSGSAGTTIEYLLVGGGCGGGKTNGQEGGGGGNGGIVYASSYDLLYGNSVVTMSLNIPELGIALTSPLTSSLLTSSFIANKGVTYNLTSSVSINPYNLFVSPITVGAGGLGTSAPSNQRVANEIVTTSMTSSIQFPNPGNYAFNSTIHTLFSGGGTGSFKSAGAWATQQVTPSNGIFASGSYTWLNGMQYAGAGGAGDTQNANNIYFPATFGGGVGGRGNGIENTGGGGGGSGHQNPAGTPGGLGGSGVVVLRYYDPSGSYTSTGGTRTVTGSFVYHTFYTNDTFRMVIPETPFY
jgi:hypothetical protein